MVGRFERDAVEIADLTVPRWRVSPNDWLHIGDEIAILSEATAYHADAYGRIIGVDAASGDPRVLVLCPGHQHRETVLKLGDILGRRVPRPAEELSFEIGLVDVPGAIDAERGMTHD
jgi:hypothetical protein